MKLKKLTINNFKQFLNENILEFNTEGKMTIVYGFNGFGKTRLHSVFYWTLYGVDRENEQIFNNTLVDKMFDEDNFKVSSKLEFTHNEIDYEIQREHQFSKRSGKLRREEENFFIWYYDKNGNYSRHKEPEKFINQIFPKELSPYFLFDGEGMTNELIKGRKVTHFSKSLKEAVNQLFGLGIYENALIDLGSDTKKLGVIAELSSQKESIRSDYSPSVLRKVMYNKDSEIKELSKKNNEINLKIADLKQKTRDLSELIGEKGNSRFLEQKNQIIVQKIKQKHEEKLKYYENFSKKTSIKYTLSLISEKVYDLNDLSEEYFVENSNEYVTRNLVDEILKNDVCVCGDVLSETNKNHLITILNTLPPVSFKHNYTRLKSSAIRRVQEISETIEEIESNDKSLNHLEQDLYDLRKEYDRNLEKLKSLEEITKLVDERERIESDLVNLEAVLKNNDIKITEAKSISEGAKEKLKRIEAQTEKNTYIDKKIDFVKQLKDLIQSEFEQKKKNQKIALENAIIELTSKMLTAKRKIELNEDFTLSIKTQNYRDSILSAGQSAVISFSYIGGVLKALKNLDYSFISKEYPLILDAPLSHLDREHIEKVFKYLPDFADQIIIFSKEEIDEEISDLNKTIYEIRSNEFKNIASIHEYGGSDYFANPLRRSLNDN